MKLKLASIGSSFGNREFRLIWLSSALSNSANWAYTVGVGWLLFTLSHSTFWVGMGMFATMFPVIVAGPFAGVIADRFNRRKIYTTAQALSTCFVVLQLCLYLFGNESLWLVIACSLALGITSSTQMVMANAMVPLIIQRDKLNNAASLMGVGTHGAEFFGAGLAAPLLAQFGINAVLGLSVALYVGAALCSARVHIRQDYIDRSSVDSRNVLRPLADGLSYIRTRPIGLLILLVGLHCALTMSFTGLLPALTSMYSEGMNTMAGHGAAAGGGLYASILTFVGLGAVIGNLATAGVSNKRMLALIYAVTAVASGITLSLLALTHQAWMMIGVGFLVGGTQAVFMASSSALVMQRTEPSFQGRVSSVYIIFAAGLMAVCNLGYGSLGTVIDPAVILIVTGLGFAVLFAAIGMLSTLRHTLETPEIARPSSGLTL